MGDERSSNNHPEDALLGLRQAQESVIRRWRLAEAEPPKEFQTVQETGKFREIRALYAPSTQQKVSTEVLGESRRFFPFSHFNRVQSVLLGPIYSTRENVMISAPTGSGKTEIAVLGVLKEAESHGKLTRAVFLAPTKSLIKEVLKTLERRFRDFLSTAQDTTDSRPPTHEVNVLVTTPERFDILSLHGKVSPSLLVVDEIHALEEARGGVLESVVLRSRGRMRIIGMSATVPNYRDISCLIGAKEKYAFYFGSACREVPVSYTVIGVKEKNQVKKISNGISNGILREKLGEILGGRLFGEVPTLLFLGARKECFPVACEVARLRKPRSLQARESPNKAFEGEAREYSEILSRGVGIHHSGLSQGMRLLVERLFREGGIRVICCTGTLACGVNLPAERVIICGSPRAGYSLSEISQMAGRAGRRGHSSEGNVVIITENSRVSACARALTFQFPVESRLGETFPTRILYEICSSPRKVQDLVEWVGKTHAYRRGMVHEETRKHFSDLPALVCSILEVLHGMEVILLQDENSAWGKFAGIVQPSGLGKIAFSFYMRPESVSRFHRVFLEAENKKVFFDVGDVILLVSTADEFREVASLEKVEGVNLRGEGPGEVLEAESGYLPLLSAKYPVKDGGNRARKMVERWGRGSELVFFLIQAHIEGVPVGPSLQSAFGKVVVSLERVAKAALEVARAIPSRSVHAVMDLVLSSRTREWRYSRGRTPVSVHVEISQGIITVKNLNLRKIFVSISSSTEYRVIHTAFTAGAAHTYEVPPDSPKGTAYTVRVEASDAFTEPTVVHLCE
ncbi:pre-mRNA-splicing helicase BRR2 [Nematocida major]|uniref:pre-mRNA-splicing helicase BRR2 n=1 Tax=Nematocida major TaxID=1912982 RepID=UPI002007ACAD|nr:pre-mRNA-splicing helicase BRR2 [Nematocida major]KAH9385381.1 pre-mRNA-splicing helicase BRR2 [Nematocida major]